MPTTGGPPDPVFGPHPETTKPRFEFGHILSRLKMELMFGRAHFAVAKSTRRVEREAICNALPLTLDAHAFFAQMTLSRILDKKSDVSFYTVLSAMLKDSTLKNVKLFRHGRAGDVRKLVAAAKASIAAHQSTVAALLRKRNWTQAHTDWRAVWHGHSQMYKFLQEQDSSVTDNAIEAPFDELHMILDKFLHAGEWQRIRR
jgi:hypothetical protein